jgi:hypothetical protein
VSPALMQLDVYSCSDLDKKIVFKQIEQFEPKEINYVTIDREKDIKIDKLVASWEKYNETRNKIKKKEEQVLLDTYCKGKL